MLNKIKLYKNTVEKEESFDGLLMCKVTGVTFDNRQAALELVENDTELRLSRDRRNPHDFYAVNVEALVDNEWRDLGFVPSSVNREIAEALDTGAKFIPKVWQKTGGGDYVHGLTITVRKGE